jgi:hypothetical protein
MVSKGVIGSLFLALSLCGSARAATSDGSYHVTIPVGCGQYVGRYSAEMAARRAHGGIRGADRTAAYSAIIHYVAGWISGYNLMAADTKDIIPNGLDGAMIWLNDYCGKNPLNSLDNALIALVTEAYPSREH